MSLTGFKRPSLTELRTQTVTDIETELPGSAPRLRRSILGVLSLVLAGLTHGLYGYLAWIARQAMPYYATGRYLEAWGAVWSVSRKPATKAIGQARMTGIETSFIPTGTKMQTPDGAAIYLTTKPALIENGAALVEIEAKTTGVSGNQQSDVKLSLVNPVSGLDPEATVTELGGGTDIEQDGAPGTMDLATYRGRILFRIQEPPAGGNAADYRRWAFETPSVDVTRVWVAPESPSPGAVTLYVMTDNSSAHGIPSDGDIGAVRDYINASRPTTAEIFVVAPIATPIDIHVRDLMPADPLTRKNVEAELADVFMRRAAPGEDWCVSWIWEAASIAVGESSHRITTPITDAEMSIGQLPVLGTVTYS